MAAEFDHELRSIRLALIIALLCVYPSSNTDAADQDDRCIFFFATPQNLINIYDPQKFVPQNPIYQQWIENRKYSYVPVDWSVYEDCETIDKWVDTRNDAMLRQHAYALWAAINKDSEQSETHLPLPIWETWFSQFEVFATKLETAEQIFHDAVQANGDLAQTLSFNKYNLEHLVYVRHYDYDQQSTLENALKVAIISERKNPNEFQLRNPHTGLLALKWFTEMPYRTGIMLKTAFWIIKQDHATPIPYWNGIGGSANPTDPGPESWQQIALIDATPGKTANNRKDIHWKLETVDGKEATKVFKAGSYKVIPLTDASGQANIYFTRLSQQQVDLIKQSEFNKIEGVGSSNEFYISSDDLEAGDLALLMGMHVTTAEFDDWTWQTFWWSPEDFDRSAQPAELKAPYRNYEVAHAYYMTQENGKPHIAFNPFLELGIPSEAFKDPSDRGQASNCMSCHRAAAHPGGHYKANGDVDLADEDWFKDRLKTWFMWSMVSKNQEN